MKTQTRTGRCASTAKYPAIVALGLFSSVVSATAGADSLEDLQRQNEALVVEIGALNAESQQLADQINTVRAALPAAKRLRRLIAGLKEVAGEVYDQLPQLVERSERATASHQEWVRQYRRRVAASVPRWNQIVDLASYQRVIGAIAGFAGRAAGDAALSAHETALADELSSPRLWALIAAFRQVLSEGLLEQVLPSAAGFVRPVLVRAKDAVQRLGEARMLQRQALLLQRRAREKLRSQVPRRWRAMAEKAVRAAAGNRAGATLNEFNRGLNDGKAYVAVYGQIDRLGRRILKHLQFRYSPRLALRAARTLQGLLEGMERNLPALELTSSGRALIQQTINRGWSTCRVYRDYLASMSPPVLDALGRYRTAMAEYALRSATSPLTDDCQDLVATVRAHGSAIDSELSYQEFKERCVPDHLP